MRDDAGLYGIVADKMKRSGLAPSIGLAPSMTGNASGKDTKMYEIH